MVEVISNGIVICPSPPLFFLFGLRELFDYECLLLPLLKKLLNVGIESWQNKIHACKLQMVQIMKEKDERCTQWGMIVENNNIYLKANGSVK